MLYENNMPKTIYLLSTCLLIWIPTSVLSQEHHRTSSDDFYLKCVGTVTRLYNDNTNAKEKVDNYYHIHNGALSELTGYDDIDPNDALAGVLDSTWSDQCSGRNAKCTITEDSIDVDIEGDSDGAQSFHYDYHLHINRLTGNYYYRSSSNEKSYLRILASSSSQGTCTKVENPKPKKF